ncbi:hypothetical protein VP01_5g7 [Puccinia sorghi]|uniref:Uncharacterized protein n=1 Tax=Puccinia sorghi TaxID=27349 RepID=A0A0L6UJJ2_9BASI|nr:hypothetical protein VP01_5g7 [Puccinia sorghi]
MRPSKLLQTDRRITATSSKATATISQARLDALDQDELGVDLSELMATLKATVRGITNFGSDVSDIKDGAQRVLRLIPRIDQARKSLLASAPSQKSADLQQINLLALRAGSRLSSVPLLLFTITDPDSAHTHFLLRRSMKAILKNPADANIIRKEYRHIRESLKIITSGMYDCGQ